MRRSDGPVGRAAAPRPSRRARGPVAPRAAILGDVTDLIAIPLSDGTQILATVKTNAQGVLSYRPLDAVRECGPVGGPQGSAGQRAAAAKAAAAARALEDSVGGAEQARR